MEIRKLYSHGGSTVVILPSEICKAHKLVAGDQVVFLKERNDDIIRLRKLSIDKNLRVQYEQTEE
jgi:antitoxin component of MazEF toxin-antitoxin module